MSLRDDDVADAAGLMKSEIKVTEGPKEGWILFQEEGKRRILRLHKKYT